MSISKEEGNRQRLYLAKTPENIYNTSWKQFLYVEDLRSKHVPKISKGLVIGIMLDKILLRINNNETVWFPLNKATAVNFFLYDQTQQP